MPIRHEYRLRRGGRGQGGSVRRPPGRGEHSPRHAAPRIPEHAEDDQIVPVKDSAKKSARLIKGAKDIYYPGAPTASRPRIRIKSTATCRVSYEVDSCGTRDAGLSN